MVERFLLHFFAMTLHTYTRATWTTPEACAIDKDVASTDYVSAGVVTAPTYLKWALVFEEPENKTVWVGKALPRSFLEQGAGAVQIRGATTRYGRLDATIEASAPGAVFSVNASLALPPAFAAASLQPPGGLRLRFRAPFDSAGLPRRMTAVTVGGAAWPAFDAGAETVDFAAAELTPALIARLASGVVASY